MFDAIRKLFGLPLPNGRRHRPLADILADRRRLEAEHAAALAEVERKAKALDDYHRENYYWVINRDRANAEIAKGAAAGSPESHATALPPPTPEQWATLTPEQKLDVEHPALFR